MRVLRTGNGELMAAKTAWPRADESRLVREAAMLVVARHPGVVGLAGLTGRDGCLELHTRWIGSRSLADVVPLPAEQAATLVGAVAATVADLHGHGISHGAIEPSHVLLDRHGHPVLCSFGRATLAGALEDPSIAALADVAALGDLLQGAVGLPDDPELVPARRFHRRRTNHLHRHLLTIADHARADEPASRPTAARLAAALAELAPGATFPAGEGADDTSPPAPLSGEPGHLSVELERLRASATTVTRPRRPRWPFGLAALGILVSVSGAAALATVTGSRWLGIAEPVPPERPGETGSASRASPVARPAPTTTTTAATRRSRTSTLAPAPIVEVDGHRYEVGQPGDDAQAAPWRCDGRARVLLLRPGTGELFIFDETARPGADTRVEPFATREGAIEIVSPALNDSCPDAAVLLADGRVVSVAIPPVPA